MIYYKIINSDNKIIGAETSAGLKYVAYQGRNKTLTLTKKPDGAYGITYDGIVYPFEEITLSVISVDEFNLIMGAKRAAESNEDAAFLLDETEEEKDTSTLDFVRDSKLKELSSACNTAIENGVDVTLSDGETHHFSLTAQDQLNLISLTSVLSTGQTGIPYHADGEQCKFYSVEDITAVIKAARELITYHTAYYNSLKTYVLSITDVKTLAEIEYGTEIPEEYQSEVLSEI